MRSSTFTVINLISLIYKSIHLYSTFELELKCETKLEQSKQEYFKSETGINAIY